MRRSGVFPLSSVGRMTGYHWLRAVALAWILLVASPEILAQTGKPIAPWDMKALAAPPKWSVQERPRSDAARAIFFTGPPFRGKATRVFAWLGVPEAKAGEKVPGMVLVHGGGGTAFDEWVRLWVKRGYAAIALDTCGQIPVGRYGHWVQDPEGGPPGWGGFDQIDRTARGPVDLPGGGQDRPGSFPASIPARSRSRAHRRDRNLVGRLSHLHRRGGRFPVQARGAGLRLRLLRQDGLRGRAGEAGPGPGQSLDDLVGSVAPIWVTPRCPFSG